MAWDGAGKKAVRVPVPVRPAETDSRDADQLFSGSRGRFGLIVQSDIRRPVESECPQGSGWP